MNIWLVFVLGGLVTFGIRLSFIYLFSHSGLPAGLRSALRYVPIAVLSAIILPELFYTGGRLNISLENPRLLAGIVAVLIAWRTRSALITILLGMAALFIFQWLLH